jgi:hypothetical protein
MSETTRKNGRKAETKKKPHTACYFDSEGNKLFVPTESMWKLHAASTPAQITKRSNLSDYQWSNWKKDFGKDHWLLDWLYRKSNPPENVTLVYPSWRKALRRGPRDGEFFVAEEMVKFREHSGNAAIAATVELSESVPKHWLKKYSELSWFENWLMRGGDAPADWYIATEGEIQRCQAAWNYRAFVRRFSMDLHNSYHRWIRETFPQDQLRAWLAWLYGAPAPGGWFIVPDRLKDLRERLSVAGIAKAAGVDPRTYYCWLKDELKSKALQDAIEAAEMNKSGKPKTPKHSEPWNCLFLWLQSIETNRKN